eukprot:CAMPEP_0183482948 /NCGR_PEP_ID=MMETSP0370-20130417/177531_1 /TAXON_ID=268820 /ORGANISM="Peridinium aciculiferum, Strain PAER-2" /LENGTH=223 /DNA_ID=CAMNT_0025676169 /DNA_START=339 /DNA_END=1007 /DNA_ORIENTATION=-
MPPRTRRCSVNVLHARQTTHLRARALVKLSERRKHNRTADSPLFTAHQPPTSETLSQSLANFRGKYKMQRGPNKVLLFGAFRLCPTIPAHPAPPLVLPIRAAVAKISGATDQPALLQRCAGSRATGRFAEGGGCVRGLCKGQTFTFSSNKCNPALGGPHANKREQSGTIAASKKSASAVLAEIEPRMVAMPACASPEEPALEAASAETISPAAAGTAAMASAP